MIVTVRYVFGLPRGAEGRDAMTLELPPGATVFEAMRRVGVSSLELHVAVNGETAADGTVLREGDEVLLIPSIQGGRGSGMHITYHHELTSTSPYPGLLRMICMDREFGAGAITQGMVTIAPGMATRPHTHLVEESMTLLEGNARILIGREVVEVRGGRATFLAPANVVHAIRNIGDGPAILCIAYPSVGVATHFVDGVEF